ncbi:MAG: hypothetical protein H6707_12430 [Deltaproteobacteria bacterium]|nr:hypothetical protein [Deltaproteobacteria bacterium]
MRSNAAVLLLIASTVVMLSCNYGGEPIDVVDPATIPQTVAYHDTVRAIMNYYCTACHSPGSQVGTIKDYDYSTYNGVVAGYSGIEETVYAEQSMPPGAARRLTAREQALLQRWAKNGFPQ